LARKLVDEGKQADLLIANNVYAHVPDVNDFTHGLRELIKPQGVITLEFPHLMRLVESRQFDTVYHEHFSYFSLLTVCRIFEMADLRIFDVEELPTHGGSLRLYGCRKEAEHPTTPTVTATLAEETHRGMNTLNYYTAFQSEANAVKDDLLAFLLEQKRLGKTVAGYGAAAKGNTLLNYAGIKPDLLSFVVDAAKSKQGKYLPGSHIPILGLNALNKKNFDCLVILPWNLSAEILEQNAALKKRGVMFVTAVPQLNFF
ncbi:MAG: class I SAM-dependent methyltransferase, partial [Proteobacteria bacterium]|nr:class I SAM-dependent methyltransferase [Pseudomonadota bacterium]